MSGVNQSFASTVKEELLSRKRDGMLAKAELSGIFKSAGSIIMRQNQYILKIESENSKLARYVFQQVKMLYGISSKITVSQSMKLYKNYRYSIEVSENVTFIMDDLQLYKNSSLMIHPDKELLQGDEHVRSYICGVFLASGSVNSPESSNYHLEMAFTDAEYAKYITKINKSSYDFEFKIIKRRNSFVVYMKKSDQIVDFLILIGATNSVLYFENERATRDFTNNYNRLNNCLIANELKSIANATEQIRLFKLLDERVGIKNIDERLRDIAYLRMENEESSLSDLADKYFDKTGLSLSKSGVNHRLQAIEKLARNLIGGSERQ